MKIIIPTFEKIEWMPPTITLIDKLIKMGHEVIYITIYPDNFFSGQRIRNISLCKKNLNVQNRIKYIKGISRILMYFDNFVKKIISHKLKAVVNREMDSNSILWVVNEMTVMYAGFSFLKDKEYLFTVYELHKKRLYSRNIVKASRNAKTVIVPEYCRAHIMKAWFNLKKTPMILPNKSDIPTEIPKNEECNEIISKMKALKKNGKTIIIYMGGINKERPLKPLLNAIEQDGRFCLAVLGRESNYLNELKDQYNSIEYLGYLKPPMHLAVAKYADIGLLIYVSINTKQALNALFCAPNKIFEYAGNGLPVIANDIPGLRFSVSNYRFGEITDFSEKKSIVKSLNSIMNEYSRYKNNALEFYNSVDVDSIIKEILCSKQ